MPGIARDETNRQINRRDVAVAAGLFALAVAVFANSIGHGFVWDDMPVIAENPFLISAGAWWRCFARDFGLEITRQPVGYYRPLVFVSFVLNSGIGGLRPFAYHLTNILLHGLNTVLVFWLIARLAGRTCGWLGAAVFAVHPVHAESVAFIAGRSDLLCALFLLLTVLATLQTLAARGGARIGWSAAALVAYAVALLSKELAVALPGVLLLCGLIHRDRLRSLLQLCAPTALLAVAYLAFRLKFFPMTGFAPSGAPMEGSVVVRAVHLLFSYAAQQTFPVIPTLGAEIPARHPWVDAMAVALLVLIVVIARPRRLAADAGAWLVLFLAPTLCVNLFKGVELSDRFAYVPSVGISALAALAAARFWERVPLSRLVVPVVLVAFAALSVLFSGMWRDEVSLWTAAVRYHPRCGRCFYNLGNAYWDEGELTGAARMLLRATRLLPDEERRCWAYSNLAHILDEAGEEELAIQAARSAIQLRPYRPPIRRFLASILSEQGRHDEAIAELKAVESFAPKEGEVQLDLAREYLDTNPPQRQLARQAYGRARELGVPRDEAIEAVLESPPPNR